MVGPLCTMVSGLSVFDVSESDVRFAEWSDARQFKKTSGLVR